MQIVFFRLPKPKHFEYKPRYYDEEKERIETRRKELEMAGKGDTATLKSEMDRRWKRIDRKNRDKAKRINLLVYLIIIAILVYFLFLS